MSEIMGKAKDAALRRGQAKRLAAAINAFMWFPDAPGGPRYADWIDDSGKRAAHFIDIAQYPLIAFGIAPPDRAEAMLATADKRLSELKERFGHSRNASLSMLWPLSPERGERCFGTYFYGGSLLASTYWEVLARARAGHVDGEWGAYRLLRNFAEHFAETSMVGSNSIDIRGNVSLGGDEGYLADMVVVPAALVHGLLGVKMSWQEIAVGHARDAVGMGTRESEPGMEGRLYDLTDTKQELRNLARCQDRAARRPRPGGIADVIASPIGSLLIGSTSPGAWACRRERAGAPVRMRGGSGFRAPLPGATRESNLLAIQIDSAEHKIDLGFPNTPVDFILV